MMRMIRAFVVVAASLAIKTVSGGVISYEGTVFPETEGWRRSTSLLYSDRTIENGWLVQRAEVIPTPPYLDTQEDDFYYHSLAAFSGASFFFLEWRVEADGPSSAIASVAPASIVAYGSFGIGYHFTIADDQIRLIRDNLLPIVFVDIEPGVPHTYLLELYGSDLYQFFIDGQLIDSGVPEGAYPTPDSEIVFGARAATPEGVTTVRWDYIRYGVIPEPATAALLLAGTTLLILRRKPRTR
jgi:hypothetical protein